MITRYQLRQAKKRVIKKYNHKKLMDTCKKVSRSPIVIDKSLFKKNLKTIDFFYEENGCWAYTNGICIYLNIWKSYNPELLYYTLFHEALHGIFRINNCEISEYREHQIMKYYDKKLL